MSVIRVHKSKNFTVMSNVHLRDKKLSLKSKGLLSMMLSLPDDWEYSIAGLCKICKENETAIKSSINELKDFGYIIVKKENPTKMNGGRIKYNYEVYETPQDNEIQNGKKQPTENLPIEFLGVENQVQINTNELNTKKQNTDTSYAFPKGKVSSCFSDEKAVEKSNVSDVKYRIEDVPYLVGQYAEPNTLGSQIIDLRNIILYFISRYEEESDIRHIDVSDSAIKSIVDAYFYPTGKVVDCEAEDYIWMIDDYFATDYKMNGRRVSKSLQHFFSGKIRENIYMKRI